MKILFYKLIFIAGAKNILSVKVYSLQLQSTVYSECRIQFTVYSVNFM